MKPPLFEDIAFDAALEATKGNDRLLLVDATASWCQPCKVMDRTTWVEAAVVEALRAKGAAIQIDVDAEKELAQRLRIRAMPTVVVFRNGAEIDRAVGLQKRDDLIGWLDGLARGQTSLDRAKAAAAAAPADVKGRMALARKLVEAERLDDATREYVWLWEHMLEHEPAMFGVRHSFLLAEMSDLARSHAPARDAFTALRDAATAGTKDWFSLNKALGETARTLAWFDGIREADTTDELAKSIENEVIPLLIEAGRWADAGRAFRRPLETWKNIERGWSGKEIDDAPPDALPPEVRAQIKAAFRQLAVKTLSSLRRALREAQRDDELREIEEAARKLDPSLLADPPTE